MEISKANFSGNIFERFYGLDEVLTYSLGKSVLDVGASDGLVAYEFARYGASHLDLIEKDEDRVAFSKRLFRDVPTKTTHVSLDILNIKLLKKELLDGYDIVLFLGVYHHLVQQTEKEKVCDLISLLIDKTKKYFVVRTPKIDEVADIIGKRLKMSLRMSHNNIGDIAIWEK